MTTVLILGSAPDAVQARDWPDDAFDAIVAINNAWRVRDDWTHCIHPEDFPDHRRPVPSGPQQRLVTYADYVPSQNRYGGVVYAGATMVFTAGYWALDGLRPSRICYFGCDMVYPPVGNTHFYGTGAADPLRDDPTLVDLAAKAKRLEYFAGRQGCQLLNLSFSRSALPYGRARIVDLSGTPPIVKPCRADVAERALDLEKTAGYLVASGRYWEVADQFSPDVIAEIDRTWGGVFVPCITG